MSTSQDDGAEVGDFSRDPDAVIPEPVVADRYRSVQQHPESSDLVIYDKENCEAWLQSDTAVELGGMA